ncbi:MAG TPA: hypothetical protein VJ785_09815 [Anaerolineales bacterium]|nr:hypothetical protein [Anaerolineales bacterium]
MSDYSHEIGSFTARPDRELNVIRIAEKLGIKFIYNTPLKKLNVEGSKARPERGRRIKNVKLQDDREFVADIIIGNAAFHTSRHRTADRRTVRSFDNRMDIEGGRYNICTKSELCSKPSLKSRYEEPHDQHNTCL